ncbi:uncharacterized protein DFL_003043 [Arthrobotrys flagrans]|uniref:C2H2-domain containing protein second zinc finger domain-containing protein n=1 Tax=Arthrobotrys flagrans TaxID=97331 RepID=A0A437AC82_ARTFL|nr:hypothetical protein DFL_003043 [Arthrobotrys flagrans]
MDPSYQDAQGGEYWISEGGQHYEDPQLAGSTVIDPQLQYEASSPTILPPGTSIANYGGYRQAGYQGNNPPVAKDMGKANLNIMGRTLRVLIRRATIMGPMKFKARGSHDRPRPEKKYLCTIEECERSTPGNGFTTLNDLERHGRSKHGDDGQYIECRHERCPDRGKRFPRRDNFVDHYWRVHGNGTSKEAMKASALEKAKEWMVVKQAGNWSNR